MAIFGDRFNVRVVDCDLVATGFGGQRQLFVSRRTTAIVDVHCMANAKKIISADGR